MPKLIADLLMWYPAENLSYEDWLVQLLYYWPKAYIVDKAIEEIFAHSEQNRIVGVWSTKFDCWVEVTNA